MSERSGAPGVFSRTERNLQIIAVYVIAAVLVGLVIFCAVQTGMLSLCGTAGEAGPGDISSSGDAVSACDVPSGGDILSGSDTVISGSNVSDSDESDISPAVSPTDVVYYPEVHIDGIVLPEVYGPGLFDEDAAMWLINEYRRQNGLYPLLTDPYHLTLVTRIRLEECLEVFSHDRPDGTRFSTAYDQVGLRYYHCAENLAYGQYTAEEVVLDWIESPAHRDNLLSVGVSYMCVRSALGDDGIPRWVFEAYSAA